MMRMIVLTQTDSLARLRSQRPDLERLLRLPGIADAGGGFSVRVPAKVLNPARGDWRGLEIFDEAIAIAEAVGGCEVQFRSMAGRWLPAHASDVWGYFPGGSLGGTDVNLQPFRYPVTFRRDGSPNVKLYRYLTRLQNRLAAAAMEARERGLRADVVHMTHPAGTWAEVFVIEQMRTLPGYDLDVIVDEHVRVMRAAVDRWPGQSEFALSGHVYPDQIRGYVYGTLGATAEAAGGRIVINRNDIRNETRFDQMPTRYPLGFQSYASAPSYWRTVDGARRLEWYAWRYVMGEALRRAAYFEVYPQNFGRPVSAPSTYEPLERVIADLADQGALG